MGETTKRMRLRSDITPEEFVKAVQQGGGVLGYAGPDVLALFEEVEEAPSGPPSYAALLASFEEMTDEAAALRAKVAELQRQVDDFENREASVCPEDVGCDEYIPILERRVAELEADKERLDWWERTLKERADHGPSRTPSYHPGESSTFEDPTPYYIPPGFQMDDDDACHPTFRAAIDAARQAGKEEGT